LENFLSQSPNEDIAQFPLQKSIVNLKSSEEKTIVLIVPGIVADSRWIDNVDGCEVDRLAKEVVRHVVVPIERNQNIRLQFCSTFI
jgi:hypothetical protein